MKKLEAIIFDWAGTTVDYGCFAPVQAFIAVFNSFGITPTMAETRKPMGMLKRDHVRTMLEMPRISFLWLQKYGQPFTESDIDILYLQFETQLMKILDQFADPKPHVLETVKTLRTMGIKIGSTTGYTDKMMTIITKVATEKGYAPDCWFSPDATRNLGRPYPFMLFKNLEYLNVHSVQNVLKIGDTVSDILEGKNAGVVSIGIIEGSSELGLTQTEFENLSPSEKTTAINRVTKTFKLAGADHILLNLSELIPLINAFEGN